jgi:protein AbiQ
VEEDYINFLKTIDNKVPDNYVGKRAYIGIIMEIDGVQFFAPLTSYKTKQDSIDSSIATIFKLHERGNPSNKLGMISINNMIPVLNDQIIKLDIENQPYKYKSMLYKQYEFIKEKKDEIIFRANKLYDLVINKKSPFYVKMSCDFSKLTSHSKTYKQN